MVTTKLSLNLIVISAVSNSEQHLSIDPESKIHDLCVRYELQSKATRYQSYDIGHGQENDVDPERGDEFGAYESD